MLDVILSPFSCRDGALVKKAKLLIVPMGLLVKALAFMCFTVMSLSLSLSLVVCDENNQTTIYNRFLCRIRRGRSLSMKSQLLTYFVASVLLTSTFVMCWSESNKAEGK